MKLSSPAAFLSKVRPLNATPLDIWPMLLCIEQDFFQPQVVQDATVFFLKTVIHDWSNEMSHTILRHLRDAATPSTKLLIMDRIVPYACKGIDKIAESIPGLLKRDVPDVLLPNLGAYGPTAYHVDLNVSGINYSIIGWVPD